MVGGPPAGGANTTVAASREASSGHDAPEQNPGRESLQPSSSVIVRSPPGRTNGRSTEPPAERNVVEMPGMALHAAAARPGHATSQASRSARERRRARIDRL